MRTVFAVRFTQAVIVPVWEVEDEPPTATVVAAPASKSAAIPTAMVRACTHPPFVDVDVRGTRDCARAPDVRTG
jgi:hypothetical protein